MGTNVSLSAFVAGTTISSSAMNTHCTSINNATKFTFNVGSVSGIMLILSSAANVATNFTNTLGIVPDFGCGCSAYGAFHLVCWNKSSSSASIVVVDPDPSNGGTHWDALFINF